VKVNLGSGEMPMDGWTNVDQYVPADVMGDFRTLDFHDLDEVYMSHALEHVSWRDVPALLARIRGWMRPGARFKVEVPDMQAIMRHTPVEWLIYVYGGQAHQGEYHQSGYTAESLGRLLTDAGFANVAVRTFDSTHPYRPGMPCLEATGYA